MAEEAKGNVEDQMTVDEEQTGGGATTAGAAASGAGEAIFRALIGSIAVLLGPV
jgi:hypothetical protein